MLMHIDERFARSHSSSR